MSQLPKGTKAARNFVESMILQGAMAAAISYAPFLGVWPVKQFIEGLISHLILGPGMDEVVCLGLAAKFLVDRKQFDRTFLELSMLDKQNASPEQIEEALQNAEKSMATFIRRGPIS